MSMKALAAIPVLRILDVEEALGFYRDYLGFTVEWEHRFEPDGPVYMQISRGPVTLHLSEHHGSGTPDSVVYVRVEDLHALHRELSEKESALLRPEVEETPWGSECMDLLDPFGNCLRMDQPLVD
jgi:uncharacterized glyoxalase superfamily protein PhnB